MRGRPIRSTHNCQGPSAGSRERFMTATDPRYFLVTSQGVSATRWIAFALASHPRVFAAHGHYAIDSVVARKFEREAAMNDSAPLTLGNEARAFYDDHDINGVF